MIQASSFPSEKLGNALRWCVVLFGLSVPISVALDNVLLALILAGALFSVAGIARQTSWHKPARAAALLFGMMLFAALYGTATADEALATVSKYLKLLFIPIFIFLLVDETWRRRARWAFLASMGLTLLLSMLVGWGWMPVMSWMNDFCTPDNPAVFHRHIAQNNMMAFAVFLALLEARDATSKLQRIAWISYALLGIINILFMVQGRTGYLFLGLLLGCLAWTSLARWMGARGKSWGWRQGLAVIAMMGVAAFSAWHLSPKLNDRVNEAISEYQAWTPNKGKETSIGQRLDFYSNTWQIIKSHPLFGVGTGAFPVAFEQQVRGEDVMLTRNPHNEYLMVTVQAGVVGLILLLYLFYSQWRAAPQLPLPLEQDAARGLVLGWMLVCTLNSGLFDHSDGMFFIFMSAVLFAGLKPRTPNV